MKSFLEILGDAYVIFLGVLLIYIFLTIEVFGYYGGEANAVIRRVELFSGVPITALGVYLLAKDIRRLK